MEYISEDNIKQQTLHFLKTYYKYRPRTGDTVATLNMVSPEGVVSDGVLTFPKEDGRPFTATFEATSVSTAGEVQFYIEQSHIVWDGLSVSSIITTLLLSIAFAKSYISVEELGWLTCIGVSLLIFLGLFLIYQLIFRQFPRYRHIFAVEQFKRYAADEQWISIGEDVFFDPEDVYLLELKKQCVSNGFGLVMIDKAEQAHLLITPARDEVFGGKRRKIQFVEQNENAILQRIKQSKPMTLWNAFWQKRKPNTDLLDYRRFKSSHWQQKMILGATTLLVSAIFYKQYISLPVAYVNEQDYISAMEQKAANLSPESDEHLIKKGDAVEYNKDVNAYLGVEDADETMFGGEVVQAQISEPASSYADGSSPDLYITQDGKKYYTYECSRINTNSFVVQDGIYRTFVQAKDRITQLQKSGFIIINALNLRCTQNPKSGYVVFYQMFYSTQDVAMKKARQIKSELKAKGLKNSNIVIRRVIAK